MRTDVGSGQLCCSVEGDGAPADVLGVEDPREEAAARLNGEQHGCVQHDGRRRGFEVQQVESLVTLGQLGHDRNRRSWIRQSNRVGQNQQTADRIRLPRGVQPEERPRQVPSGAGDRGPAGSVVPLRSGVVLTILVQTDEDLLDQESVVEDDPASVGHLLIDQLWVIAGCEAELVTVP